MKLLLTGPQGNLGSAIIKHSPFDIVKLDKDDWPLLDGILSEGIDVVIHTAYDLKNRITELPTHIMDSNLISTMRLIEAMHKHGTPRLVFISTCAVYGSSMKTNEETPCCPVSINGLIKLLNEKIIAEYCFKNNITYEIYRVFNVYGGNDHFSILNYLLKCLSTGDAFVLNNKGISQRDFIHVDDVARIIIQLIQIKHKYTHLNIGTGVSTKISELVSMVISKYPNLQITNNSVEEAEYSRADITKLLSLIDYSFIDVCKYIQSEFNV